MGILNSKIALITGGASGIGRATATLFSNEGAAVAIADINKNAGKTIEKELLSKGSKALFIPCDVSSAEDCQRAVETTINTFGALNILFNNAGIIRRASVVETTEAEWDKVLNINLKSIFLLSKYAIPHMEKTGGGVIINTASGWGLVGGRKASSYCASKGGVVLLTKAMALDHADQNIRVNCICPGDTDTAMLRSEAEQLGEPIVQFLKEAAERPLKRMGKPEDIAQAVLYLASDASSFVTGVSLVVDGGGLAG